MAERIDRLLQIMAQLRDPEKGCPWDLKQDFRSIVPYTLEEAYEVAEAIEHAQWDELRGELGDLLFQVVFYAQLAEEQGLFAFGDVVESICEKMIRRHPHVFAGVQAGDERQLREDWEQHKRQERNLRGQTNHSHLDGVSRALPGLVRADKLQRRAAQVGFDWPSAQGALEKSHEELDEIEQAIAQGNPGKIQEELGDYLFAVVNLIRLSGFDAEQTLRSANRKFEQRFRNMEKLLAESGRPDLTKLSLEQLETAWTQVKEQEI